MLLSCLSFLSNTKKVRGTALKVFKRTFSYQRPTPYEYAVLSQHVYRPDLESCIDNVVDLESDGKKHTLYDWKLLDLYQESNELDSVLQAVFGSQQGYVGAVYCNERKKQLVLSHRGTQLTNVSAVITDVNAIARDIEAGQSKVLPFLVDKYLEKAKELNYQLSTTGHSLGAWLAELTVFFAWERHSKKGGSLVASTTFDSPGSFPAMDRFNPRYRPISLNQLDMRTFLSSPNLINCCNRHAAQPYRIGFDSYSEDPLSYTLESHSMRGLLSQFDSKTGLPKECFLVKSWPLLSNRESLQDGIEKALSSLLGIMNVIIEMSSGKIMGEEYPGFFDFAKKANSYIPEESDSPLSLDDSFMLKYLAHYNVQPFDLKDLLNFECDNIDETKQQLQRFYLDNLNNLSANNSERLEEVYVSPVIVDIMTGSIPLSEKESSHKINKIPESHFSVESVLELEHLKKHTNTLMVGRAGVGKSTCVNKIVELWSTGNPSLSHIHWLFWFPLRQMVDLLKDPCITVSKILHTFILSHMKLTLEETNEWEKKFVRNDPENMVLFLLDGLDEIDISLPGLRALLLYPCVKRFIASRDHQGNEFAKKNDYTVKELVGFNDKGVEEYIKQAFPDEKKRNDLMAHLRSQPNLWNISHTPLRLYYACLLYRDIGTEEFEKIKNLTSFYEAITNSYLRREVNEKYVLMADQSYKARSKAQHFLQNIDAFLQRLAYCTYENNQIHISAERFDQIICETNLFETASSATEVEKLLDNNPLISQRTLRKKMIEPDCQEFFFLT